MFRLQITQKVLISRQNKNKSIFWFPLLSFFVFFPTLSIRILLTYNTVVKIFYSLFFSSFRSLLFSRLVSSTISFSFYSLFLFFIFYFRFPFSVFLFSFNSNTLFSPKNFKSHPLFFLLIVRFFPLNLHNYTDDSCVEICKNLEKIPEYQRVLL